MTKHETLSQLLWHVYYFCTQLIVMRQVEYVDVIGPTKIWQQVI